MDQPRPGRHQALNQRLRTLPAALFGQVLFDLLPRMDAPAGARTWHRYPTSQTDPAVLPVLHTVPLCYQRRRMEEAFLLVKRLLGLA